MPSRRHCLQGAALLALAPLCVTAVHAKPEEGWALQGQAQMRWFGLLIYDIRLWAEQPPGREWWSRPLALELRYARSLDGSAIAERSLVEMRRQQAIAAEQGERWLAQMRALFPDVKAGDRLAGRYLPGRGAEFFFNEAPRGRVDDALFARLFFGIWLAEQSSEPALRARLLGLGS